MPNPLTRLVSGWRSLDKHAVPDGGASEARSKARLPRSRRGQARVGIAARVCDVDISATEQGDDTDV